MVGTFLYHGFMVILYHGNPGADPGIYFRGQIKFFNGKLRASETKNEKKMFESRVKPKSKAGNA